MWVIYITYGVVFALGANFSYTLAIHVTTCYFPGKHYSRAMSIVTNGTPAGLLVLSPTMERLYTYCGWRNGLRILAAFVLVTGGVAALIVKEPTHNPLKQSADDKESVAAKEKLKSSCEKEKYEYDLCSEEETTTQKYLSLIRLPEYWILFIATTFSTIAAVFNVINLVSYMEHVGVENFTASLLVGAMSVSEFLVRGAMAIFSGRCQNMNNLVFLSATCFMGGVAAFGCTAGSWLWLIIIYVLVAGLSRASFYTMCYVVTRDIFGIRLCAESNSLQLIAIGVGCLVTSTITGLSADMTGSYHLCFYIVGSLWIVAALLYTVVDQLTKRKKTNPDDFMTDEEKSRALKAARYGDYGVLLSSDQVYEKFIIDRVITI
ncbi:uncharacterized protein [Amphiura filiformis]|uniref:uncharacterized protein isoform X1 n=1 Tax=Amphiura filiformis TaxID=82378 RepID=UPI003B222749